VGQLLRAAIEPGRVGEAPLQFGGALAGYGVCESEKEEEDDGA